MMDLTYRRILFLKELAIIGCLFQIIARHLNDSQPDKFTKYIGSVDATLGQRNDSIIRVEVAGTLCRMLIDSGAQVNTLAPTDFEKLMKENRSKILSWADTSEQVIKAYGSENPLKVLAIFYATLFIDERRPSGAEKFFVIDGATRSLLGRETATRYGVLRIGLNANSSHHIWSILESGVSERKKNGNAKLYHFPKFNIAPVVLKEKIDACPRKCAYTNIPFAWRAAAEQRIQEMLRTDIIEAVTSEMSHKYCSAMLAVPKGSDDFRLVVDLREPNKWIIREPHSMPTLESILSEIKDSRIFSTIDLSNAFHHVVLARESRHVTNFFTGQKMFRFKRLPFGLCNAPDIFQSTLEQILVNIPGIMIYLDDILIFAKHKEDHDASLKLVLEKLESHGVILNKDKCQFSQRAVKFLGFMFSEKGYEITEERRSSIMNFRRPSNISEVKSFLGTIVYLDRFIFNRASETKQLQSIVREHRFVWTSETDVEFDKLRKEILARIKKLGYYKQGEQTTLIVDASQDGLGAVLLQTDSEGKARIIACASKTLSHSERNYPQVQREALAIVWGVERFQLYLRGQHFTILTDNQGNEFIFGNTHKMGKRWVSRAEAWALRLLPFDFNIKHVAGEDNIADVFSRLVIESHNSTSVEDFQESHLLMVDSCQEVPIASEEIAKATEGDEALQLVLKAIGSGKSADWKKVSPEYRKQAVFLSVKAGVVLFKSKLVIPSVLRDRTLKRCHRGHFGIGSMKRALREHVWWPNINQQVVELVENCETCQRIVKSVRSVPLRSRALPDEPWQTIQIDFLDVPGCGSGKLLMIVDTYSRMTWAVEMKKIDASTTIKALTSVFNIWGRPEIIISDNGQPFRSSEFRKHWESQGIRFLYAVPRAPWMNGMVERRNKGVIKALTAAKLEGIEWRSALETHIHLYNNVIPHPSTGATPFELLTGRMFRGEFPSLPGLSLRSKHSVKAVRERDETSKMTSISYANERRRAEESDICPGDWVWITNFNKRNKLDSTYVNKKFKVVARNGPRASVEAEDGQKFDRWVSELKKTAQPTNDNEITVGDEVVVSGKRFYLPQHLKAKYKVLLKQDDKLLVKSDDGDTKLCRPDETVRVDKFRWSSDSQLLGATQSVHGVPVVDPTEDRIVSDQEQDQTEVDGGVEKRDRPKRNVKIPARFLNNVSYILFD